MKEEEEEEKEMNREETRDEHLKERAVGIEAAVLDTLPA
jgi:hypothetical protein